MSAGRAALAALVMSAFLPLTGCSLAPPARPPVATYDFGPPPAPRAARLSGPLLIPDVAAPPWLDTPSLLYRLAYADAAEPRTYGGSRWVAPPAQLLTQRMRASLVDAGAVVVTPADGARADRTLRVELEEFSQVFDSPQASRAVLRLRATVTSRGSLSAQRTFAIELPAATAEARGAASAMGRAADEAIARLIAWLPEVAPVR